MYLVIWKIICRHYKLPVAIKQFQWQITRDNKDYVSEGSVKTQLKRQPSPCHVWTELIFICGRNDMQFKFPRLSCTLKKNINNVGWLGKRLRRWMVRELLHLYWWCAQVKLLNENYKLIIERGYQSSACGSCSANNYRVIYMLTF